MHVLSDLSPSAGVLTDDCISPESCYLMSTCDVHGVPYLHCRHYVVGMEVAWSNGLHMSSCEPLYLSEWHGEMLTMQGAVWGGGAPCGIGHSARW